MAKARSDLDLRIWDLSTRLFHVGLIVAVAGCWYSYTADDMAIHRLFGYGATALLIFRIYWGLVGSSTARFFAMVASPRSVWRYVKGDHEEVVGHNPLGSWGVVLILSLLAAQVATGLFSIDASNLAPGPLSDFVSADASEWARAMHGVTFQLLKVLVAIHVSAVFVHELRGDNLIGSMVHGRKRFRARAEVRLVPWWYPIAGAGAALLATAELWHLAAR